MLLTVLILLLLLAVPLNEQRHPLLGVLSIACASPSSSLRHDKGYYSYDPWYYAIYYCSYHCYTYLLV